MLMIMMIFNDDDDGDNRNEDVDEVNIDDRDYKDDDDKYDSSFYSNYAQIYMLDDMARIEDMDVILGRLNLQFEGLTHHERGTKLQRGTRQSSTCCDEGEMAYGRG